jgi:hypothetical protein
MARRPGVLVRVKRDAPGGESPNAYVPELSVQVHANWTPLTPFEQVHEALWDAYVQTVDEVRQAFGKGSSHA